MLTWGPLKLNAVPDVLAASILLSPFVGLIVGSLLPDKAIRSGSLARALLVLVLGLGIIGTAIVATDHLKFFQGPNFAGFWFHIAMGLVLGLLFFRVNLARSQIAQ